MSVGGGVIYIGMGCAAADCWTCEERPPCIAYLRLASQVIEKAPLPEALHVIPVLDEPMPDGVVDGVRAGAADGLVADVEVEVRETLRGLLLRPDGLHLRARRGHDVLRLDIAREAHFRVSGACSERAD